jgi:hypothetical protein
LHNGGAEKLWGFPGRSADALSRRICPPWMPPRQREGAAAEPFPFSNRCLPLLTIVNTARRLGANPGSRSRAVALLANGELKIMQEVRRLLARTANPAKRGSAAAGKRLTG